MTEYAWFDKGDGRQVYRKVDTGPAPKRSHLATPMIITDTMDALQYPGHELALCEAGRPHAIDWPAPLTPQPNAALSGSVPMTMGRRRYC